MCGIIGVVNGEKSWGAMTDCNKYMEQGATVGVLRGQDSTGMFQVDKGGKAKVYKLPIEGGYFASTKRAGEIFRQTDNSLCTVLHHRAATRGEVSLENTHPFEHRDGNKYLVGVHNGSLYSHMDTYDGQKFSVDSDYALRRIFREREGAFQHLNGSYAFVWWEDDGKLRIACNGERSFSFGFIKGKNAMLMASEPLMLAWLAERNSIKLDDVLQPENFRMLTFDPSDDLRSFEDTTISKPFVRATNTGAGRTIGNFPRRGPQWEDLQTTAPPVSHVRTQDPVSGIAATNNSSLFTSGMEVEFYPTIEGSTKEQLVGDVLLDGSDNTPVIMPAVLVGPSAGLFSNLSSGQVSVVYARVRSFTKIKDGDTKKDKEVLLLDNPSVSVSDNKLLRDYNQSITIDGPAGRKLDTAEFLRLVDNGCGLCGKVISLRDGINGNIGWNVTGKTPICSDCVEDIEGRVRHAG